MTGRFLTRCIPAIALALVALAPREGSAAAAPPAAIHSRLAAYEAGYYAHSSSAIPAFARKYGLACSACHTAWPELNAFGQAFRDNGYQLGNERDSPINQSNGYFPVTVRVTPNWHLERATNQPLDATPGDPTSGLVARTVTQSGFDLSGMDLWFAGTLYKDISFVVLPSTDNFASFHFEAAFVRFDNLFQSRWVNVKLGKFELDNMISEKRFLNLSGNGGAYQSYHFVPAGDVNDFGLGDNQIGMELAGHSINSRTRYGIAVLSSTSGNPGLVGGKSYDTYLTLSHAMEAGSLGLERFGGFGYLGQRPTNFETSGGTAIPGTGTDNKSFYRVGLNGDFFFGRLELMPLYMHASDNVYLGTGVPVGGTLPAGAVNPVWNGAFLEAHYYVNPQLVFTGRYETIRMSRQADPATPANLGNTDAITAGLRWYPIMFSRAGLAWHAEYSVAKVMGAPLDPTQSFRTSSLMLGFDFDF
ncbi:MAG TPA: hypothetical protein VGI92_06810 [Gemmatimonadales bacterium]|jgi:hypothetical protein